MIAPVIELLQSADAIAREVGYPDRELEGAYHRQVLMLLAQGYVQVFGTHVDNPGWVPHTGSLFPWGAPNHDTVYGFAPIDARGTYRVSGTRGSESIATLMFRKGGANTGQLHGATLGEIDVQAVTTARDRHFSLLISAARPADHAGPWFPLPPDTTGLVCRHVTEDPTQEDGVWSLERLDARVPALSGPEDANIRMQALTGFVRQLNEFLLRLVKKLRDGGHVNALVADRFQGHGGIAAQMYFQGTFDFATDEALIIESDLPASVHYWSVQLLDPFHSAIDFIHHSAAFNGRQARISPDGKVRFVISTRDPGVPNWLDTAGWRRGGIFWRWHTASSYPMPVIKRLRLTDLRGELPVETPEVNATQRARERSSRIAHYQSRRRY